MSFFTLICPRCRRVMAGVLCAACVAAGVHDMPHTPDEGTPLPQQSRVLTVANSTVALPNGGLYGAGPIPSSLGRPAGFTTGLRWQAPWPSS
jgi:hypothetical protein